MDLLVKIDTLDYHQIEEARPFVLLVQLLATHLEMRRPRLSVSIGGGSMMCLINEMSPSRHASAIHNNDSAPGSLTCCIYTIQLTPTGAYAVSMASLAKFFLLTKLATLLIFFPITSAQFISQLSPCPQDCAVTGPDPAQWTYYHAEDALDTCNETTIF